MASPSLLQATDLHGGYPGLELLSGINLQVRAGDAPVGIVGPSGSGKTTLVRLLAGRMRPTAGQVTFNSRPIRKLPRREAKTFNAAVRFMSQDSLTIGDPKLTVERNIKAALAVARKAGRTHGTSIAELLDAVGLAERYIPRPMLTLSGGERQRVALATALATRPEILVLDEPLTAVDPPTRGAMSRRLGEVIAQLGTGVLLVSHDLELVERMCDHVHFLADGTFVAAGPLGEVLATSEHPSVRELAEAAPLAVQRFR